jgi:Tfp pilus assembly protein PilN
VRPSHLRKCVANSPPILGFTSVAALCTFDYFLCCYDASLVSAQLQQLPCIIMYLGDLHGILLIAGVGSFLDASNFAAQRDRGNQLFFEVTT